MKKCDISIIIVNFNSALLLKECLQAIRSAQTELSYEVIVIDNASNDDPYVALKESEKILWIQNTTNYGFAKACNKAARKAKGEYLIFLNVDTRVLPKSIELMIRFLKDNPDVGACGPAFVDAQGRKRNSVDNYPSIASLLLNKNILRFLHPKKFPHKRKTYSQPIKVESLVGACFCIRKEIFHTMQGYDEGYFFYMEETDLCWRLNRQGYRVMFLPQVTVVHHSGQSAKKYPLASRIEYHKSLYLFLRRRGFKAGTLRFIKQWLFFRYAVNAVFHGVVSSKSQTYWRLIYWHLRGCPLHEGLSHLNDILPHVCENKHGWNFIGNEGYPPNLLHMIERDVMDQTICVGESIRQSDYHQVLRRSYEYKGVTYPLVVKVYLFKRFKDKLKTFKQKAKGFTEWKTSWQLKHRRILTPTPILYAERRRFGVVQESIFIVEDMMPMKDGLEYRETFKKKTVLERRAIIKQFADFMAHMHNHGFYHRDLDVANILVDDDKGQRWFYVIDLHRVHFVEHISLNNVVMNFVYLYSSIGDALSLAEKFYFLNQYQKERNFFPHHWRKYFENIDRISQKICANQKPFLRVYPLKIAQVQRNMIGEWMPRYKRVFAQLPNLVRSADYVGAEHILKQSHSYRVFHELSLTGHLCCKQIMGMSLKKIWQMHREWQHSVNLFFAGVRVPKPIAYLYRKRILVMRYLADSQNADKFFYSSLKTEKERLQFMSHLGDFIGDLHAKDVFHNDLTPDNILVLKSFEHKWTFYLIDHGHVRLNGALTQRQLLKNISQMWGAFPEGLLLLHEIAFFKAYQKKCPIYAQHILTHRNYLYAQKQALLLDAGYVDQDVELAL